MPLTEHVQPEDIDRRGFSRTGNAGYADPAAVARIWQTFLYHFLGNLLVGLCSGFYERHRPAKHTHIPL